MNIKKPPHAEGDLLLVQPGFFGDEFMVMSGRFKIINHQSHSQNNENAGNDVSDNTLENRQLIDAKEKDEASKKYRSC